MIPQYSRYYVYIKPFLRNPIIKTYSSFIFSLITITIFALYAIKPTLATIVGLQKSIKQQEQVLNELTAKAEALTLGKKNYDNLDEKVKSKIISLVPNYTSIPNLIDNLATNTVSSQASISGIQVQPVELIGPPQVTSRDIVVKEIDFTISNQGAYTDFTKLIDSIGKSNRLIYIKSINFNKPSDNPLIMTINGKAYFFKQSPI